MKLKHTRTTAATITVLILLSIIIMMTPFQVVVAAESEIIVATGNISDYIWSSDGTRVAYVVRPDGQSWGELWVGDWNGYEVTNLQLLYSEIEVGGLEDWQGDWILLRIRHENDDPEEYYGRGELWKIRDNGTELTQITFTYTNGIKNTENGYYYFRGSAGWGRFIPGTDLVYFSAHNGNGWWKAYTCSADGSDQWKRISGSTFSFTIGMSPTGNKLVWGTSWYWDEPTTFLSSNIDGTETITMKEFSYKTSPLVLADGDTVMYNCPDGNIGSIFLSEIRNRNALNIEYSNYLVNYNPVDGQSFLMRSNRSSDGNSHIFSVDVDGTSIVQLTTGPYNEDSAIFSPDGYNILYRRLPVDSEGASYELVIIPIGKQIEDLPSASITMLFVGDSPGNNINATITIGFYSNGNSTGIGFHQELVNISTESGYVQPIGLGYDEMREHSFFSTIHGNVTVNTLSSDVVSHRHYAAWTESEWFGTWNGPISEQNISEAIFCGDIIQFENLEVYFEDGSSFVCNPQFITLAAIFTRTGELWNTSITITTSHAEGISIDNNVLTISIRYPQSISTAFYVTIITTVVVVAGVLYLSTRKTEPEFHDEYVTYN